jgi:type I restriction enzyme S subunit
LEAQKQAIIQRIITRGTGLAVTLRSSGVEWIGDVPAHWRVLRSRYLFREIDLRSGTDEEMHLSMSQKLGLVPSEMVEQKTLISESYAGGKTCEPEDLVLNRLKAHLGVFALANQRGVVSPDYTVFRKRHSLNMKYFVYVLRSPLCRRELRIRAKGIVQGFWRLYTDDFYDIRLPVPPVDEQDEIVRAISLRTEKLETYVAETEREIALLRELWTRLIADLVSGKVDVRTVSQGLPEEAEEPEKPFVGPVTDESTDEIEEPIDAAAENVGEEADA